MAYKIVISKKGQQAGDVHIESLDSSSCSVVKSIIQSHNKVSGIADIHHDDNPPIETFLSKN